ncbi:unnamed protein product [Caenorhabditis bovis]|uniref:SSD domain-containing protein n=1 Tax=Caenorhabditis bovis TaxID=2654633 RepID=A0A8S1FA36_9PELO|nr:unnamed protein product [Caenorhabditis bovis]
MTAHHGPEPTRLIRLISAFFEKWAYFVANHAVLLIVVCTVLTLLGTLKVATTPNENDITGYTPYGARARDEFEVMTDYFAHNGNGIAVFLLLIPKNYENVLNRPVLKEALRRSFLAESDSSENSTSLSDRITLNYPISTIYSRKMNIQPNFFGVEMKNSTAESGITNIKSSKLIAFQIRSERKDGWTTQKIKDFEMQISDYFDKEFVSQEVRVLTLSTSNIEAEVVRAGMSLLPFLVVGFAIMAVVSSVTTFISALYMHQVSIHKFSLALAACICPFMACGTALGTLFICGVRFGSVLCVTPFLVLAIGVDDAYLMIHSWQRVTAERRKNPIADDSSASRLAEVLIDTGPAILISALTNIFADVAGCFTSSPELTLLAYGNMACIFCDFLYQITFYAAIMTITARFEMRDEDQKKHIKKIACGVDDESESNISNESFDIIVKKRVSRFLEAYISILTNAIFQFVIITLWLIYLAFSIFGILIMNINLSPKKLFMEDSSLIEMDDYRVDYVVPHFYVAQVFVTRPGDLSDGDRLGKLDEFVDEMERINGSWGAQSTNYFVRDMRDFEASLRELDEDESEASGVAISTSTPGGLNVANLPMFLEWPEYAFWKGFVQFHNESSRIVLDKFFITFAIHGDNLRTWPARGGALRAWRHVVDKYKSEFGLSVYSDDGIYVDLIENMPTDAWQSAVATLSCMALICFIFMYDIPTVIVATSIIASIMTGILGVLSFTGTDLDPIVMSALIISIGFSVDIPAHITYHYHASSSADSVDERLHSTLSSVGFPALQASFSTSLCVLSLKLTSVYMSNVFVKTMIVCMILCVFHALLLLPCLFSLAHRILSRCRVQPAA